MDRTVRYVIATGPDGMQHGHCYVVPLAPGDAADMAYMSLAVRELTEKVGVYGVWAVDVGRTG